MLADSKLHLGLYFYEQKEYKKAIEFGLSGNETAIKAKNEIMQTWSNWLLGASYCQLNKLDTALMYAQKSYDIIVRIKYYDYVRWTYETLGEIQAKLANKALAVSYFDLAIEDAIKKNSLIDASQYYTSKAQYYFDINRKDSSSVYAKKGLRCSLCNTPTNSILSYLYVCHHCQFTKEAMYPNNITSEDPTYCNYCNP